MPNAHVDRPRRAHPSQRSGRTCCWTVSRDALFPRAQHEENASEGDRQVSDVEYAGSNGPDAHVKKVSHRSVYDSVDDVPYATSDKHGKGDQVNEIDREFVNRKNGKGEDRHDREGDEHPDSNPLR